MLAQREERLGQVLDAVNAVGGNLQSIIECIRDVYGLRHLAYLGLNLPKLTQKEPYVLVTYGEPWIEHYKSRGYVDFDPVVHRSLRTILPTDWAPLQTNDKRVRELFNEARLFGIGRQGVSIPVRGPRSELALFSATSDDTQDRWQMMLRERMAEFQVLAHHLHSRIAGDADEGALPHLSRREIEVLYWAGNGKSVQDTATILGISHHTVRTYVEMARAHLNAVNTTHAVSKALALGLIRTPEFGRDI
jgi:DNA-binding CsgD family transcriptional regulator